MNLDTINLFTSATDGAESSNAKWETPPEVFAKLQRDFGPFDLDLFADETNHLLDDWLGPGSLHSRDALTVSWAELGFFNGYGNPPYGRFVRDMLAHAKLMAAQGCDSTLLLPVRITKAFDRSVMNGASQVYFCDRRITFYENGAPRRDKKHHPQPALFDSMIVRYMRGYHGQRPVFDMWRVPPHGRE